MNPRLPRRLFLARAAGGAAGLLILPSARMLCAYPANERLRLAVFGAMYNAEHFLTAFHIYNADQVAVCNPDHRKLPGIVQRWEETAQKLGGSPKADEQRAAEQYRRLARREGLKVYADIRRMFGEMASQIDALVISDYDHSSWRRLRSSVASHSTPAWDPHPLGSKSPPLTGQRRSG